VIHNTRLSVVYLIPNHIDHSRLLLVQNAVGVESVQFIERTDDCGRADW
jgi:hypothetical protein